MPMPDNWRCVNCLYAEPKKKTSTEWLLCKRFPPVYNKDRDKSFFPDTHSQDRCGEFKNKAVAEVRGR